MRAPTTTVWPPRCRCLGFDDGRPGRKTVGVHRIEDIGRLGSAGASVAPAARNTGVPGPTAGKRLREGDLSERPPEVGRSPRSPILEPCAEAIDSWLAEDGRRRRRRRHAARRVCDGLVEEAGLGGAVLDRAGVREGAPSRARRRARLPRGAGAPAARLAARGAPCRLRAGRPPRAGAP